jgi:2-polyprenyl-3-methyl-5-hydroxy-6-metoxy-1,4-benzoquinol methylase
MDKPGRCILSAELRGILRCTKCHAPLDGAAEGFVCAQCGSKFPFVRGVYRFAEDQDYAASFGWQWQRYATTQLDTLGTVGDEDFRKRTGIDPQELYGKLVLDVGCGMGRFAEVATRWGAQVVGIDLSNACEMAAQNLAARDFVALQADALKLPFAPESFDYIYSIGVLHHTPDCEKSFKSLPQYLKLGGTIAVWLYSGYNKWYRFSDFYRKFTRRISPRLLHSMLRVAVPFFYWLDRGLRAIPLIGRPMAGLVHYVFPVNLNPDPQLRLLDTFDWYSPQYQSKHTYEEVFRWYESCGLEALTVGELTLAVRGRKPNMTAHDASRAAEKHATWELPTA